MVRQGRLCSSIWFGTGQGLDPPAKRPWSRCNSVDIGQGTQRPVSPQTVWQSTAAGQILRCARAHKRRHPYHLRRPVLSQRLKVAIRQPPRRIHAHIVRLGPPGKISVYLSDRVEQLSVFKPVPRYESAMVKSGIKGFAGDAGWNGASAQASALNAKF